MNRIRQKRLTEYEETVLGDRACLVSLVSSG